MPRPLGLYPIPRLGVLRHERVLTQAELAAKAGITRAALVRIERGGNARASTVRALARALDTTLEALLQTESAADGTGGAGDGD